MQHCSVNWFAVCFAFSQLVFQQFWFQCVVCFGFSVVGVDGRWVDSRVSEPNICGRNVAIMLSHGISGLGMGLSSVEVESHHDFAVVEVVSMELNGSLIHSSGHVLGMAVLVSGAIHGGKVNVIAIVCGGIAAFDLDMHCDDISIPALESAVSVVDIDMSRGFLVLRLVQRWHPFLRQLHSALGKSILECGRIRNTPITLAILFCGWAFSCPMPRSCAVQ